MWLIALLLFFFGGQVLLITTVRFVPHGYAWTIERFGKYSRTAGPGLVYLIPVVDRVGRIVDMTARMQSVPSQEVATRDNVMVTVDGMVFFTVIDAAKATYGVAGLDQAMVTLVMSGIRDAIGAMDLVDAMSKRDAVNVRLFVFVDQAAGSWGVKVDRVEIKSLRPPQDVVDAMAREMEAEREKRRPSKT